MARISSIGAAFYACFTLRNAHPTMLGILLDDNTSNCTDCQDNSKNASHHEERRSYVAYKFVECAIPLIKFNPYADDHQCRKKNNENRNCPHCTALTELIR